MLRAKPAKTGDYLHSLNDTTTQETDFKLDEYMRIETQLKKIEELEILFKSLFNRGLHTSHLLKIRQLAFTLILSSDTKKNLIGNGEVISDGRKKLSPLNRFKANLSRRKTNNSLATNKGVSQIPEPYRAILKSDIAYVFRDEINDYAEIDFKKPAHTELLHTAINMSIAKVNEQQGRPANEALAKFFIGLRDLYEVATGEPAHASAHFDEQPNSNFEKLIYLGYQIVRGKRPYPSALKAYQRAIARQS
tara:strand:+ start:210 stop:956 length:747 start_codon:yes stop_codon:yes gene_type:complete